MTHFYEIRIAGHLDAHDLSFVKDLIEAGKATSVINRTYPFENTAEAVRYVGGAVLRARLLFKSGEPMNLPFAEA